MRITATIVLVCAEEISAFFILQEIGEKVNN